MTNKRNGTLYVGVTSNLLKRVYEHKHNLVEGFTNTHKLHALVYYEIYDQPLIAFEREKQLKKWRRKWKLALIEKDNPHWQDLYNEL